MNDIINLFVHGAFALVGIGVGFALGIVTNAGRDLGSDLRDAVEHKLERRRVAQQHSEPQHRP